MSDWLDELLGQLPSEPAPDRLIPQVRLRLARVQRRALRIRRVQGWLAAAAGTLGAGMLFSGLGGRIAPIAQPTAVDLEMALAAASTSPIQALVDLSSQLLGWVILSLALLALSALYGASRLIVPEPRQHGVMS
jgi:anti-sigma factor RsiW